MFKDVGYSLIISNILKINTAKKVFKTNSTVDVTQARTQDNFADSDEDHPVEKSNIDGKNSTTSPTKQQDFDF